MLYDESLYQFDGIRSTKMHYIAHVVYINIIVAIVEYKIKYNNKIIIRMIILLFWVICIIQIHHYSTIASGGLIIDYT